MLKYNAQIQERVIIKMYIVKCSLLMYLLKWDYFDRIMHKYFSL